MIGASGQLDLKHNKKKANIKCAKKHYLRVIRFRLKADFINILNIYIVGLVLLHT